MSRDADALAEFLADFKDCKSIVDLVEHPRKGCHTIVAVLSAQIVGLAMIEETVPVEALTTQFCVKSFINLEHHPPANQACVTLLALSPIFRHRRRLFLREIMRQTEKTLLYCPIFPDQDLPDVIEDMLLIPARQHVYMSPSQKWGRHPETIGPSKRALRRGSVANFSPRGLFSGFDCALYFTTHRLTSRHRIPVNSKILVAGASRTAEAFLHKLIANPLMQFTNVTLVSPCGFMGFSSSAASILDVESGPARCFSKLGIDCQVGLKSSLVTDFDREAQTITLKNGEVLSYDLFIMTTGMQDQTGCKLGISAVKEVIRADEFLARLDVITGSLEKLKVPREVLVDGEGHAVVYGSTLEAFYVIQLLLSRGLRGSNIVLCHAEKKLTNKYVHGDANILSCLLEELAWCQVAVKSGLKLVGVTTNESGSLKAAKFEAQGEEEDEKIHHELPCCLLVTCERKQVDIPLFNVMRRENIIFDGRVIVDGKFQTNDPLIYAAGTACKFSRNCGKLPKLETFCSQEVGEALAASLISRFNSHLPDVGKLWLSYLPWFPEKTKDCGGGKKWPAPVTPLLGRPKCTGGILPGGVQLFSIVLPSCHTTNWDDLRIYSMLTKFSNFYARVDIAENKQLARILYAGKVKADAWKFSQVVGLPVSLLNSLPRRYSDGSLNDIMNFLLQPWSSVLFHDDFLPFYTNLTQNVVDTSKSHPKGGPDVSSFESCDKIDPELAEAISRLVRKELLKFIEKHRLELPMYTLPRKKVDLRLLLPRVISSDDVEVVEKKKQTAAAVAAAASAALVTASDLINTAFEQLIQKAETEERDKKTIKEIVGQLVQGMEELKPVLLTLRGEGYIGPTVDHLIKEIDKKVLSISVWDESLDLEGREDEEQIKRAIQGMIGLLEQSSPVMLALDRVD
ncbi:cilia- and flagella-associated protein 61 [Selaginella moellendorffii]|nr:cilia- and flagella-associated protein 61 [Selaginella moellendorffii]|eukprot:XP_024540867.1 cilia- and flagella-associated protein 61 [Selaginella moellendorffii]